MINRYKNYNDYELLYLIQDGSQKALDVLFEKYEVYISKIVKDYIPYGDKRDDLMQEGRIILYSCIKRYRDTYNVSFFSYFSISLKRAFNRLITTEYYSMPVLNESITYLNLEGEYISNNTIYSGEKLFKDKLLIALYNECILGSESLSYFAKKNNLKYSQVYYKYNHIISVLKKILPID